MESKEAEAAVRELIGDRMPTSAHPMINLIQSLTVLRLLNMFAAGSHGEEKMNLSKEQLLELNSILNSIQLV